MLTIGKIGGTGGGQWRSAEYYTEQVARGAEDYYAGHGEAPGTWTGQGAAGLGLAGEVGDGELEAVFDRRHPLSGDQLGRVPGVGSVRGIDLQMAVPKSVSTLWALADEYDRPEIAGKVWEATHGAASAAFDYLERHACKSRAGAGGKVALQGEGFVATVFPHRFSREGDPQVHVHVLVANMTHCGQAEGVEPSSTDSSPTPRAPTPPRSPAGSSTTSNRRSTSLRSSSTHRPLISTSALTLGRSRRDRPTAGWVGRRARGHDAGDSR